MITRLVVENFRGIGQQLELDFARLTLLTGRNGLGKTTVFDAIDWCLFGSAWRLGEEGAIRNLYGEATSPRVSITIKLEKEYRVDRDEAGVRLDGVWLSDREFMHRFMRDVEVFGPYSRDVEARIRKLVYLPQAEIRDLVKPAAESERVAILHGLLGVPGAAVVEKSLRRIKERMEEKERDLLFRAEEVQGDIAEARRGAEGLVEAGRLTREVTLESAKRELGAAARGVESLDGLAAVAKGEVVAAQRRRASLVELRAWLAESAQRRAGLDGLLKGWRKQISDYEAALVRQRAAQAEAVGRQASARAGSATTREWSAPRLDCAPWGRKMRREAPWGIIHGRQMGGGSLARSSSGRRSSAS